MMERRVKRKEGKSGEMMERRVKRKEGRMKRKEGRMKRMERRFTIFLSKKHKRKHAYC